MRYAAFLLFILAGCDTPGFEFKGVKPTRVVVDGSAFDIRVSGQRAEAIRVTPDPNPRWMIIGARAGVAIEKGSGCRIIRMAGDPAVVKAYLKCPQAPDNEPLPLRIHYVCEAIETYQERGLGYEVMEMTCDLLREDWGL